jgi:hypothetical protein
MATKKPLKASADVLGAMIDEAWTLREKRLTLTREADAIEAREKELKATIEGTLRDMKLDGAKGHQAVAAIKRTLVAQITDEDAYLKWASLKANRDCLKVGVVGEAYRERIAAKVKVPGVEPFTKEDLSLTKAK